MYGDLVQESGRGDQGQRHQNFHGEGRISCLLRSMLSSMRTQIYLGEARHYTNRWTEPPVGLNVKKLKEGLACITNSLDTSLSSDVAARPSIAWPGKVPGDGVLHEGDREHGLRLDGHPGFLQKARTP